MALLIAGLLACGLGMVLFLRATLGRWGVAISKAERQKQDVPSDTPARKEALEKF